MEELYQATFDVACWLVETPAAAALVQDLVIRPLEPGERPYVDFDEVAGKIACLAIPPHVGQFDLAHEIGHLHHCRMWPALSGRADWKVKCEAVAFLAEGILAGISGLEFFWQQRVAAYAELAGADAEALTLAHDVARMLPGATFPLRAAGAFGMLG